MVKKIQYLLLIVSLGAMAVGFKTIKKTTPGIKTIVIDPGHGGRDPGCHGVTHKEKDISLAVALKLGKFIEEHFKDVKVVYTRTTDVFVELEDRAQIANKAKADLFISIHCNAAGKPVIVTDPKTGKKRKKMYRNKKGHLVAVETINPVPFGTETYVMGLKNEAGKMRVATRENSAIFLEDDYEKKYGGFDPESEESYIIMSNYTSAYVIQSANLAVKIQDEYTRKAGRIDKGVHRQSIWVLWRTSMPSILTEIGYLTNPLEETFMGSEQGQDYLARAIFRGIRKFKDEVEGTKKEYNDEFENQAALENENIKAGNSPYVKKNEEEDVEDDDKAGGEQKNTPETPIRNTIVDTVKEAPQKVVVNDGKGPEIIVDAPGSAGKTPEKKDTVLSAKAIAEKFRNEKRSSPPNETPKPVPVKNTVAAAEKKTDIVFKVQIASSDTPIDLKQEKYSAVVEGDFYKLNGILKYTSGNFSTFKAAASHQDHLRKNGFKDCFVIALQNDQRIDLNAAKKATMP